MIDGLRSRRQAGFSIIELLVVIAIIGILVALLTGSEARLEIARAAAGAESRELARIGTAVVDCSGDARLAVELERSSRLLDALLVEYPPEPI